MNHWAIGKRGASILVAAALLAVSYLLMTAVTTFGFGANAQPSSAPEAVPAPVPAAVPGPSPDFVSATPGNGEATVEWRYFASSSDLSLRVTPYELDPDDVFPSFEAKLDKVVTVDPDIYGDGFYKAKVTRLDNDKFYKFTVRAVFDDFSEGPESADSGTVIPSDDVVGLPPTDVRATSLPNEITVTWMAPNNPDNKITGYTVTSVPGGVEVKTAGTKAKFTSLTVGTSYTFTVKAFFKGSGLGAASEPSNAVIAVGKTSGAKVSATGGDGQATITWTLPTETQPTPIDFYNVQSNPDTGAHATPGNTRSFTMTGLTNGTTYTFTVKAVYTDGTNGDFSLPSNQVTPPNTTFASDSKATAWLTDPAQSCPSFTDGDLEALIGLNATNAIVETVWDALDPYSPAILGEQIPNIAKIITGVVFGALRESIVGIESQQALADKCGGELFENYVKNFIEQRSVHLQVIELEQRTKFLVSATIGGKPVSVALESVQVIDDQDLKLASHTYKDVTASTTFTAETGAPGLYIMTISPTAVVTPPRYMNKVDIYRIVVKHDEGNGVVHDGSVIFDRDHSDNLAMGQ